MGVASRTPVVPNAPAPVVAAAAHVRPTHARTDLSRKDLHELVWSQPMAAAAAGLGLSLNGLAKICDRVMVPYPGRGYWGRSRPARPADRAPLPPAPSGCSELVSITPGISTLRRSRTRLSPDARREQLIDLAGAVIARHGLSALTMKRVAREAGVSETQAHNYFRRREDLLVALARRELASMFTARDSARERGLDASTRIALSTVAYLRHVSQRGALIQVLLNSPEVRLALREERRARAMAERSATAQRLQTRYGVEPDIGYGTTVILTAVTLRAGRLVAERKIPLEMAERLSLALIVAGNRAVVKAPPRPEG
ncbi:TetR/AcrR family transcriptional regulator [Caulobacter sp. KR2-114]|uniref:TetR/AcrR family transcriptional regulator n=1 Tax=Caulobacter sp. KR2-114 TaxID=3400912 RepID=UPI003C0F9A45